SRKIELHDLAGGMDRRVIDRERAFVHELATVRPFHLVTGEEDRALRILVHLPDVVEDRSAVEHPPGGDDDLGLAQRLTPVAGVFDHADALEGPTEAPRVR